MWLIERCDAIIAEGWIVHRGFLFDVHVAGVDERHGPSLPESCLVLLASPWMYFLQSLDRSIFLVKLKKQYFNSVTLLNMYQEISSSISLKFLNCCLPLDICNFI